MHTNDQKLFLKEEVFRIVGCAIDLIAFDAAVVDRKVIEQVTDHERGLMLNYLRTTKLRIGVILNLNVPSWSGSGVVL